MADLLPHLMVPTSPQSSQDSFRSASDSQPNPTPPPPSASASTAALQATALRAAGLPVYDVDAYLNDPKNVALHSTTTAKSSNKKSTPTMTAAGNPEPVLLGTSTTHHVAALNQQCQAKGFLPVFDIEGDAINVDFGGVLKIGDVTISSDRRWRSKKEAREGLAEKGLEALKGLAARARESGAQPAAPGRNYVGQLLGRSILYEPPYTNHGTWMIPVADILWVKNTTTSITQT